MNNYIFSKTFIIKTDSFANISSWMVGLMYVFWRYIYLSHQ